MTGARYAALGTGTGRMHTWGEHRACGRRHPAGDRIEDRRQLHEAVEQQLVAGLVADGACHRVHSR